MRGSYMMRRWFVTALLFFCVGGSVGLPHVERKEWKGDGRTTQITAGGRRVAPGFQLLITADKEEFAPYEAFVVNLVLRNLTDETVVVKEIAPWRDYSFDVRTEYGESLPLTENGRLLLGNHKRMGPDGFKQEEPKVIFRKLKPGSELKASLKLEELFPIRSGSLYFVTARRSIDATDGSGSIEIISNTIRVEITR
jgi:hypothetical protein